MGEQTFVGKGYTSILSTKHSEPCQEIAEGDIPIVETNHSAPGHDIGSSLLPYAENTHASKSWHSAPGQGMMGRDSAPGQEGEQEGTKARYITGMWYVFETERQGPLNVDASHPLFGLLFVSGEPSLSSSATWEDRTSFDMPSTDS